MIEARRLFDSYETRTKISFGNALQAVVDIAESENVGGEFFSMRQAELLENAARNIREKLKEKKQ